MVKDSEIAWNRRDHQAAIDLLERASRLAPAETILLFYLGRCHGLRYDYAVAERCFDKAVRAEGWKPESFLKAGRYCLSFSGHEMAMRFFERAIKSDKVHIETLVELARIYMRQNRLPEANELVDRACRLDAGFAPALLARATLSRMAGQPAEAETLLRSFVGKPQSNGWIEAESWYELGGILDRLGRYDEAAEAFFKAKAVKLPAGAHTIQNGRDAEKNAQRIIDFLSAETFRRWHQRPSATHRPVALLAGHPRSGTTLLEQVLDAHPGIVSTEETQIFYDEAFTPAAFDATHPTDFFLPVLDRAADAVLQRSEQDYFACSERYKGEPLGNRLLIDKNPSLTAYVPAFARILPQAKFLVALRDPRDVCLSCFMQPLFPTRATSVVYPDFETTIIQYAAVMKIWQAAKPLLPGPWLEVRYEDLLDDLAAVARRTVTFLDVPWNDNVLQFQQHTRNKLVRSPTYADVRKPISKNAVGRWRHYQKHMEPWLDRLEPFVKAFGYG